MSSVRPTVASSADDCEMALLRGDRWHLWRNLAQNDEPEDWCDWQLSVPDTGQDGPAALADLWQRGS